MKRLAHALVVAAFLSGCAATTDRGTAGDVVAAEHWVQGASAHDGSPVRLYLRERHSRSVDPSAAAKAGKVVVLAHGVSSVGSLVFDVQVTGHAGPTYSLMDYLASEGFDVFAVDFQNFGRSDKHSCGLCVDTDKAARDLDAAVDHVRKLRGVDKVHLVGWSWGTHVAALQATRHANKVRRLVMLAPPLHVGPRGEAPMEHFRKTNPAAVPGFFEPAATDPAVIAAWARAIEQSPTIPNGAFVDLLRKMPLNDPKAIAAPTMIIYGELDRATPIKEPNLPVFFGALQTSDRQLTVVPGAGHMFLMQKPRMRVYREVARWLSVD